MVKSVYAIRLFNVALAALLMTATIAVTPRSARLPVIAGFIVGVVPLGMFVVASLNNPVPGPVRVCALLGERHTLY